MLDAFSGTGVVAAEALRRGVRRVVAVDNLHSNTVILRGFAERSGGALEERIRELNGLEGVEGYISREYAGTYFSLPNCRRMDAARELIETWSARGEISVGGRDYLIASFLLAADRVANTVGQYDAFLKHMGSPSRSGGRHLVDGRVYSDFCMLPLEPLCPGEIEVLTGDIVTLAAGIEADVAYLDPPYNSRQYCDLYHVLENLARWEKPRLAGKTRKPPRDGLRSAFSRSRSVVGAFRALLEALRARSIFLSYNSEGLLRPGELQDVLSDYGSVTVTTFPYPVFGSGAGVAAKRVVTEYLFHLRRGGA